MKPILLIILTCNVLLLRCGTPDEARPDVIVSCDDEIYIVTGINRNMVVYKKVTAMAADTVAMKLDAIKAINGDVEVLRSNRFEFKHLL